VPSRRGLRFCPCASNASKRAFLFFIICFFLFCTFLRFFLSVDVAVAAAAAAVYHGRFFAGAFGGIERRATFRAYLLLILALRFKLQGTRAHQYKWRPIGVCVWLSAAATATAAAAAATAAAQKTRNSFKNANVHQRGSPKMAEFVVVSLFCQIVLLNFLENFCIVLQQDPPSSSFHSFSSFFFVCSLLEGDVRGSASSTTKDDNELFCIVFAAVQLGFRCGHCQKWGLFRLRFQHCIIHEKIRVKSQRPGLISLAISIKSRHSKGTQPNKISETMDGSRRKILLHFLTEFALIEMMKW